MNICSDVLTVLKALNNNYIRLFPQKSNESEVLTLENSKKINKVI